MTQSIDQKSSLKYRNVPLTKEVKADESKHKLRLDEVAGFKRRVLQNPTKGQI